MGGPPNALGLVRRSALRLRNLSMNLGCVRQTFLSAGSGDFPVARSRNTGQECPVNPQAGKPALRAGPGSWSKCMRKKRKGAFHEPQDASLANEQVAHLGFMVPM